PTCAGSRSGGCGHRVVESSPSSLYFVGDGASRDGGWSKRHPPYPPLLHQRRFRTLDANAFDVRRSDQVLQVLADADLPDALVELGTDRPGHRLVGQLLAFDALVDEHQVVAVATFQRLGTEPLRQTEQLT